MRSIIFITQNPPAKPCPPSPVFAPPLSSPSLPKRTYTTPPLPNPPSQQHSKQLLSQAQNKTPSPLVIPLSTHNLPLHPLPFLLGFTPIPSPTPSSLIRSSPPSSTRYLLLLLISIHLHRYFLSRRLFHLPPGRCISILFGPEPLNVSIVFPFGHPALSSRTTTVVAPCRRSKLSFGSQPFVPWVESTQLALRWCLLYSILLFSIRRLPSSFRKQFTLHVALASGFASPLRISHCMVVIFFNVALRESQRERETPRGRRTELCALYYSPL